MKNYGFDTEMGTVIRAIIRKGQKEFEYYEIEDYIKDFFKINFKISDVSARLSNLKTAGILTCRYYDNPKPNPIKRLKCGKRAVYTMNEEAIVYYKELYKEEEIKEIMEEMEDVYEDRPYTLIDEIEDKQDTLIDKMVKWIKQ